jgi:catechol 2,3-dioxygenase-like lactoylglutathione lyase family enzyme
MMCSHSISCDPTSVCRSWPHRRRPAHASDEEVAGVIEEARANGAEIIREPSPTFYGGYAGGFRDPDGHVWEVAHNPGFGLTDDGSVILPER